MVPLAFSGVSGPYQGVIVGRLAPSREGEARAVQGEGSGAATAGTGEATCHVLPPASLKRPCCVATAPASKEPFFSPSTNTTYPPPRHTHVPSEPPREKEHHMNTDGSFMVGH